MRCDLHVHSLHSGPTDLPLLRHIGRDSYTEPGAVYETARRRGMDLVTLTDHDTIEGALALSGRPDTFLSEEVTCTVPGGRTIHLGVFDLQERQHHGLARRRDDAEALFAYLAEQRLPACLNHPFSALTGRRETGDLALAFGGLPLVEVRNGMMPDPVNRHAAAAARAMRRGQVGGSDAHSLGAVARAFTEVPQARSREEFTAALREGLAVPLGRSGSYALLTLEVARIFAAGVGEAAAGAAGGPAAALRFAATLALLPALPLIPLFTAAMHARERWFGLRHFRRFRAAHAPSAGRPRRAGLPAGAAVQP